MMLPVLSNRIYQTAVTSMLISMLILGVFNFICYMRMSTVTFVIRTYMPDQSLNNGASEQLAFNKSLHYGQLNGLFNEGFEMRAHVCVASVSCGRPALLNRTLSSVIRHLSNFEKEVIYETVLVDCGKSDFNFLREMQNTHNITKLMVTKNSEGIAFNFNAAFFGLCRSQFILSVEEDWGYIGLDNYQPITMAMELLNAVPKVWGVILRSDDWFVRTVPSPEIIETPIGPIKFQRHCYNNSWGAYTNGASIYRASSMHYLPAIQNELTINFRDFSEYVTSVRAGKIYCVAHIIRNGAQCDDLKCNTVFEHLGTHNSSPGHRMIPRPPVKPWGFK